MTDRVELADLSALKERKIDKGHAAKRVLLHAGEYFTAYAEQARMFDVRCELVTPPSFGECAGPWGFVVLHRPLARKLVVADRNVDAAYFVLGAGQSHRPAFRRKPRNTQTKTKPTAISRYRPFVLLRCVHTNNNNLRPPGACSLQGYVQAAEQQRDVVPSRRRGRRRQDEQRRG